LEDVTEAAEDTTGGVRDLNRELKENARKAEIAAASLDDLTAALWGAQEASGDLAQARKDLAELLKNGPETKSADDIAIWKGKVAEARETLFELQYQMKQAEGPEALLAWLLKVRDGIADTNTEARAAIDNLIALQNLTLGRGAGGRRTTGPAAPVASEPLSAGGHAPPAPAEPLSAGGHAPSIGARATGGPASGPTLVGEQGPEIVDLPGGSNVINARDTEKAMGGTTTIINLTVQGDLRAKSKEDVVSALRRAAAFAR
jgi:hypothetical protein